MIEVAAELGYYTIQWSLDSLDWKIVSKNDIVRRIMERVKPGDIILFHNDGLHTAAAVDEILTRLLSQGYQVVPVSQLIYKEGYYIEKHSGAAAQQVRAPAAVDLGGEGMFALVVTRRMIRWGVLVVGLMLLWAWGPGLWQLGYRYVCGVRPGVTLEGRPIGGLLEHELYREVAMIAGGVCYCSPRCLL